MTAAPSMRWMDDLLDTIKNNGQFHVGTGVLEPRQVETALLTHFIWTPDAATNDDYKSCVEVLYGTKATLTAKDRVKKKLLIIYAANMTFKAAKEAGKVEAAAIMSAANAVARVTYRGIELDERVPLDAVAAFPEEFKTMAKNIIEEPTSTQDLDALLPRLEFSHPNFGELVEVMIQLAIVAKIQWWKYK